MSFAQPEFVSADSPRTKKPESAFRELGLSFLKGWASPLENEFQAQLNISRTSRSDYGICSGDIWRGIRCAKGTGHGRVFIKQSAGFWIRELRVVQYVEKLRAELKSYSLRQASIFH